MDEYEGYTVRQLTEEELPPFQEIVIRAYPVMLPENFSAEAKESWLKRMKETNADPDSGITYYGCFKDKQLFGGMIFFDFRMNLFNQLSNLDQLTNVGGVGLVCAYLLHKKEHVAKNIMKAFHNHYHSKGFTITALYLFVRIFMLRWVMDLVRK